MSQGIRLGIIGAGPTGKAHAAGAKEAGFHLAGVADRIPDRLSTMSAEFKFARCVSDAEELIRDPGLDALSICLPTHLHASAAISALRSGKHVLIEMPPAPTSKDAKAIARAAEKSGKVVLYAAVRRFGSAEQSVKQAIDKGYAGKIYHARATWLRTRGVPKGTGWYWDKSLSGGGAGVDLGLAMIDLLIHLIGSDVTHVSGVGHACVTGLPVEEFAHCLLRFESGASAEVSVAWAINQVPSQAGTTCRIHAQTAAVDIYTPRGPVIYREFDNAGHSKPTPMKQPRWAGYPALFRHFKECIQGKTRPLVGPDNGVKLMQLAEALYKSIESGKTIEIKRKTDTDEKS